MIESIYDWLADVYRYDPAAPKAILAGLLVSTVCGVIGCFIILRRMSFLSDALSHSMLAGVVGGYLLMKLVYGVAASALGMLIGAMIAGFLTVAVIGLVTRFSRVKEDTAIGVMYTGIFALGGVLASLFSKYIHIDLMHFLIGQLLAIRDSDLWMMAFVSAFVLAVVILFFRTLQLISFDRVMAASIGVPVILFDYLLTVCTSLVVVSGVTIVGVVLVVALLITPAATAYLLTDRLKRMLVASALFGVSSFLLGFWFAKLIGVAPGSAVVVAGTAQFFVVLAIAPRYGLVADWLRRRRTVPQQLVEDVLGSVLRSKEKRVSVAEVVMHVDDASHSIYRAIRLLVRQGLLDQQDQQLTLTEEGRREARRLQRAHRLWETYLDHLGTPAEQLHDQAHRLEHVHDEDAVDYLDDMLGHPLRDPHGSEIPEDFVHLVPGTRVKASLLRSGHRAVISAVEPPAEETPLEPGMKITAGDRQQQGTMWNLILPDGREVLLDHAAADAVTVVLES